MTSAHEDGPVRATTGRRVAIGHPTGASKCVVSVAVDLPGELPARLPERADWCVRRLSGCLGRVSGDGLDVKLPDAGRAWRVRQPHPLGCGGRGAGGPAACLPGRGGPRRRQYGPAPAQRSGHPPTPARCSRGGAPARGRGPRHRRPRPFKIKSNFRMTAHSCIKMPRAAFRCLCRVRCYAARPPAGCCGRGDLSC